MDKPVPERFSTPRSDIDIVTRAARVPALLTAYPLKGADNNQVDMHLQSGIRTSLRRTMASVVQGPFIAGMKSSLSDEEVILPAVAGVGYFIHSYHISCRNAVANTATNFGFYWTSENAVAGDEDAWLLFGIVPLAANVVNMTGLVNAITLPGDAVKFSQDGTYADNSITLMYSVVSGVM